MEEQWSRNLKVQNQVNALLSFVNAFILITKSLREDLKPIGSLVAYLQAYQFFLSTFFFSSKVEILKN